MAERQGFEPWNPCGLRVFQTRALDHYATPPKILKIYCGAITAILRCYLAESGGFEPPVTLRQQRFSRPPHSTTLPTLQNLNWRRRKDLNLRSPNGDSVFQDRCTQPLCDASKMLFRYKKLFKDSLENIAGSHKGAVKKSHKRIFLKHRVKTKRDNNQINDIHKRKTKNVITL